MYVILRYPFGIVVEGVVLANGKNRMRVAVPGFADVIELKRSGANWVGADSQCVELEFMMSRSCDAQTEVVTPMHHRLAIFANAN